MSNINNDYWVPKKNSYGEYSRGHLVPAGDYRGDCKKDTFFLILSLLSWLTVKKKWNQKNSNKDRYNIFPVLVCLNFFYQI